MTTVIAVIILIAIAVNVLPVIIPIIVPIFLIVMIFKKIRKAKYKKLENQVLNELGLINWEVVSYYDDYVTVKSRQALDKR